ncbi:hypothetical protein AVEN_25687-1 [Araneus ventricosus]|uniref:Lipase domain-containing protein n=1 Tax=Araneus ventricosus TaxID=182803 RepID=A0A4Y2QI92_ARAVE|nr:hypothetical protein AVEN_25687-1 [Araneus ventricosus]
MGDLDFYPNGGKSQPQCQKGSKSASFLTKRICNHSAAISYFLQSVNSSKCNFLASKCDSYSDFQKGLCSNDSSPMAEMGQPAKPISGLPPKSEFFLRTSPSQPYCLQGSYESK